MKYDLVSFHVYSSYPGPRTVKVGRAPVIDLIYSYMSYMRTGYDL